MGHVSAQSPYMQRTEPRRGDLNQANHKKINCKIAVNILESEPVAIPEPEMEDTTTAEHLLKMWLR